LITLSPENRPVLHSLAQPYKKWWHNALDTLIFANLAIINGITLYNFTCAAYGQDQSVILISVQNVMIFLPIIYVVGYTIVYFVPRIKAVVIRRKTLSKLPDPLNDDELPARLIHRDSSDSDIESSEYHSFQDQEIEIELLNCTN